MSQPVKIIWSKILRKDHLLPIAKDFASRDISFDEFRAELRKNAPILSHEVDKMGVLGEDAVRHRLYCSLNQMGIPTTGFRRNVEFYP